MNICQKCKNQYNIDLSVPDGIWVKISPKKSESGLLCPNCICESIDNQKLGKITAIIHGSKDKNVCPDCGRIGKDRIEECYLFGDDENMDWHPRHMKYLCGMVV